jgi:hypothetical protein
MGEAMRGNQYRIGLRWPGQALAAVLGALVCAPLAAQTDAGQDPNKQVLQNWQQTAGNAPGLVPAADGGTRIEWKANVAFDVYRNEITAPSASPQTATPLRSGDFQKLQIATEIKLVQPAGDTTYLQASGLGSNDRSVLTRYPDQLTNLQAGRTSQNYKINAGDFAASLSSLGTNLGMRGLSLSRQFESWGVTAHAGTIADSWEALANRRPLDATPARSRFLRDAYGVKLDNTVTPEFKAYVSAQGFSDREGSLPTEQATLAPADGRAATVGFTYQQGQFNASGETALSRYQERDQLERKGHASILDSTYRIDQWAIRAGYHDVNPNFVSLSQAVPPGIKESYLGADWVAATWITLGLDLRDTQNRTPAIALLPPPTDPAAIPPPQVPSTANKVRSVNGRAAINFGPEHPGWNLGFNSSDARGEDNQGLANRNYNFGTTLAYASPTWTMNTMLGRGKLENAANPQFDSKTTNYQLQLGRNYSGEAPAGIPLWTLGWNANLSQQTQRLVSAGTETKNLTYGLGINAQRIEWGRLALTLSDGSATQPAGGPDLKTRSVQLEATRPLGQQNAFKVYLRDTHRNVGAPTLQTEERVGGVQLNLVW